MALEILNKQTERTVTQITDKIKLRKNGVTADAMTEAGIRYTLNYGVAIPHLKQIAANFTPDNAIARALWQRGWRETMLMAIFLMDLEKPAPQLIEDFCSTAHTDELFQQLGMVVIEKLPNAKETMLNLVQNDWKQATIACYAFVKFVLRNNDPNFIEAFLTQLLATPEANPMQWSEINARAKALAKCGRLLSSKKETILAYLDQKPDHKFWNVAREIVKTEFEFSND